MVEHYEASSIKQLSTNNYEFRKDSGCDFLPEGGYGELLKKIAKTANLNIHLNKVVENISYNKN